MRAVFSLELRRLVRSPSTWVIAALLQIVLAWYCLSALEQYLAMQSNFAADSSGPGLTTWLLGRYSYPCAFVLLLAVPVLSMQSIAADRQAGSFNMLLASPVSAFQICLAKFGLILSPFAPLDLAAIFTAHSTLWGFALCAAAVGLLCSATTASPVAAAFTSSAVLLVLWLIGNTQTPLFLGLNINDLSFPTHIGRGLQGVIHSVDWLYFISLGTAALACTVRCISNLRQLGTTGGRWFSRVQDTIFYLLCGLLFILILVVSNRYSASVDTTRGARNSLSDRSAAITAQIDTETTIGLYSGHNPGLVQASKDLVSRYTRANSLIRFEHKNIELDPSLSRLKNIQQGGEIIISQMTDKGENERRLEQLTEATITDGLSSLLINGQRRLHFLSGHGERNPSSDSSNDLANFTKRLSNVGYSIETITDEMDLPAPNAGETLVVASPKRVFSPTRQLAVAQYLNQGGNLLWLHDSGQRAHKTLSRLLPLTVLPGVIVDAETQNAGLPSPDFALSTEYAQHELLGDISGLSLFPRAVGLLEQPTNDWLVTPLLLTSESSWNETGKIEGNIQPDQPTEQVGPLPFAFALEGLSSNAQRVLVIGDGDFLANNWLGNGSNAALGERFISWLTGSSHAPIPAAAAPADRHVAIAESTQASLALALFAGIPLCLFGAAAWHWRRSAR